MREGVNQFAVGISCIDGVGEGPIRALYIYICKVHILIECSPFISMS